MRMTIIHVKAWEFRAIMLDIEPSRLDPKQKHGR
jgi:hypothetical protein